MDEDLPDSDDESWPEVLEAEREETAVARFAAFFGDLVVAITKHLRVKKWFFGLNEFVLDIFNL